MITCTPETLGEFRAALRAQPDIHAFVAELHRLGLIDGLRHARIGPVGSLGAPGVTPTLTDAAETRLLNAEWARQQGSAA